MTRKLLYAAVGLALVLSFAGAGNAEQAGNAAKALKALGVEEKELEGEVLMAIIDTKDGAAGEITETHFFDKLNKTFYRVSDSFKYLDNKRGKKLKIKARIKGNTIENADVIQDQGLADSSVRNGAGTTTGRDFARCPVIGFPGWPGVGPWLVQSARSPDSGTVSISTTPISNTSAPLIDDNSTLISSIGNPFSAEKKTLVIVVDFNDQRVQASDSEIQKWYFQLSGTVMDPSVASFYETASDGRVSITGNHLIRVQIPDKFEGGGFMCGTSDDSPYLYWGSSALFAAKALGVDESNYDLVSFVFPDDSCLDATGVGYFFSRYSFLFWGAPEIAAHEIGHNLGFHHGMSLINGATGSFLDMMLNPNGDWTDVMGGGIDDIPPFSFFNSVHTDTLNWYPTHIVTKNVGIYKIVPMSATNTDEPKIIQVPEVFPWLVSYRIKAGLDVNLEAPEGVYLHLRNPGTDCGILVQEANAGYTIGGTFYGRPVAVEVLQTDSSAAYVRITSVPYGGEPAVQITDPLAGEEPKETRPRNNFPVTLRMMDNVNVVKGEVFVDQANVGTLIASDSPYSANTYYEGTIINGDLRSVSLGQHSLIAKVTDNDGKTSLSDPVPIIVTNTPTDNSPPTVTLVTDPPNGGVTEGGISVSVDANDNVAIESLQVLVNNVFSEPGTCSPSFYIRKPPFTIQCGFYLLGFKAGSTVTVDVTAVDTTGNSTKKTSTLTYTPNPDTEPPKLELTAPANGAIVAPNTVVPINITVSDNKSYVTANIKIDGTGPTGAVGTSYCSFISNSAGTTTPKSYTCNWTVPNLPGTTHYIKATASDGIGANGYVVKQVAVGIAVAPTIDATPPAIIFSSPIENSTVTGTAVPVKLNTIDTSKILGVYVKELNGTVLKWFGAPPFEFTYNADSPALRPGPHTIYATAEDIAGNIGRKDLTFTIKDIRAPGVTLGLSSPPTINYKRGTVNIIASASDDDKVSKIEHYLDGVLVYSQTTLSYNSLSRAYSSTWAWNTDLAAEGAHQLYAKAYDPTGNVGTSSTYAVFVDRTAPTTTLSVAPISNGTVSGNVTLTAVPSDAVGVIKQVLFYKDSSYVGSSTSSPYTAVVDTRTLSNGSHTFKARAYDMASNYSAFTTVTVTVANGDTTPPTVTLTAPVNGAFVGSNGATLSATASDANGIAKVEFLVDGVVVGTDTASPYSLLWSTANVAAGTTHTMQARAYDTYNNVNSSALVTVTVEKTPPTVALTAPLAGAVLAGTTSLSATASDASGISKVEFYANGVLKGSSFAAASPYTFSWNTTLVPNSTYSLTAKAYDKAGNTALSAAVSVYVRNPDTTPPSVTITSPANGALVTNSTTVNVSANASDFNGIKFVDFYVNGEFKYEDTVSPYVFPWVVPAGAGITYSLQANAIDNSRLVGSSAVVSVTSR